MVGSCALLHCRIFRYLYSLRSPNYLDFLSAYHGHGRRRLYLLASFSADRITHAYQNPSCTTLDQCHLRAGQTVAPAADRTAADEAALLRSGRLRRAVRKLRLALLFLLHLLYAVVCDGITNDLRVHDDTQEVYRLADN